MLEELLTNLTSRQRDAVEHVSGPSNSAGAGTGKTTTITGKIACMIKVQGVKRKRFSLLLFQEKLPEIWKEKSMDFRQGTNVKVSTFHAFCAELIRDNLKSVGFRSNLPFLRKLM